MLVYGRYRSLLTANEKSRTVAMGKRNKPWNGIRKAGEDNGLTGISCWWGEQEFLDLVPDPPNNPYVALIYDCWRGGTIPHHGSQPTVAQRFRWNGVRLVCTYVQRMILDFSTAEPASTAWTFVVLYKANAAGASLRYFFDTAGPTPTGTEFGYQRSGASVGSYDKLISRVANSPGVHGDATLGTGTAAVFGSQNGLNTRCWRDGVELTPNKVYTTREISGVTHLCNVYTASNYGLAGELQGACLFRGYTDAAIAAINTACARVLIP